jgi:TIR domain-containing protein/PAN domain-containing protein
VPAGVDWDTWIRQHLASCKCAIVFWSSASITSRNVRHEATIADQEGKLIPVLLEPLNARQFPMGLYAQQAANLVDWNGDLNNEEWNKLRREYEAKLMPGWVRQQIDQLEAELVAERARRQGVERRDKTLQAQITKEAETQLGLQRERDSALDEIAVLKGTVDELTRARSEAEAREIDTVQQVAALKVTVDEVTRAKSDAEQRLSKLRQTKAKEMVRSISPVVIAAAVATVGIWTYQLLWPVAPQSLPAVISVSMQEAEQQRLKEEEQLQAKAADAEAKLQAAEAEQQRLKGDLQRQTKAAGDTDAKLKAAEADQQRLKEEAQRQAKAAAEAETKLQAAQAEQQRQAKLATDADAKRRGAEAEQQRLAEELRKVRAEAATKQVAPPQATSAAVPAVQPAPADAVPAVQPAPAVTKGLFEIRANMEARETTRGGPAYLSGAAYLGYVGSVDECQQKCTQSASCNFFTFRKADRLCYGYSRADLVPNEKYDSGVRK